MRLDFQAIYEARPENVERLARALRVPLPPRPEGPALLRWKRHAARTVADEVAHLAYLDTQARGARLGAPW